MYQECLWHDEAFCGCELRRVGPRSVKEHEIGCSPTAREFAKTIVMKEASLPSSHVEAFLGVYPINCEMEPV